MAPAPDASLAKAAPKPKSKAKQPAKKEKIFHPESRKAGQLARTQLRKAKLADADTKRHRKNSALGAWRWSTTSQRAH